MMVIKVLNFYSSGLAVVSRKRRGRHHHPSTTAEESHEERIAHAPPDIAPVEETVVQDKSDSQGEAPLSENVQNEPEKMDKQNRKYRSLFPRVFLLKRVCSSP